MNKEVNDSNVSIHERKKTLWCHALKYWNCNINVKTFFYTNERKRNMEREENQDEDIEERNIWEKAGQWREKYEIWCQSTI